MHLNISVFDSVDRKISLQNSFEQIQSSGDPHGSTKEKEK